MARGKPRPDAWSKPHKSTVWPEGVLEVYVNRMRQPIDTVPSSMTYRQLFARIVSLRQKIREAAGADVLKGFKVLPMIEHLGPGGNRYHFEHSDTPSNAPLSSARAGWPTRRVYVHVRRHGQLRDGWYFPPVPESAKAAPVRLTRAEEGDIKGASFGAVKVPLPRLMTVERMYDLISAYFGHKVRFVVTVTDPISGTHVVYGPPGVLRRPEDRATVTKFHTFGKIVKRPTSGDYARIALDPAMGLAEVTIRGGYKVPVTSFSSDANMFGRFYDPVLKQFNTVRDSAAATIQAAWRGKQARNVLENLKYRPGGPGYHRAAASWARAAGGNRPASANAAADARAAAAARTAAAATIQAAWRRAQAKRLADRPAARPPAGARRRLAAVASAFARRRAR